MVPAWLEGGGWHLEDGEATTLGKVDWYLGLVPKASVVRGLMAQLQAA